jgi:hypothetical protein
LPFNAEQITTLMGTQQEVFRFERKFVVTEAAADSIQQFVSAYLDFDEHMAGRELSGYRVCSLYLDTPDLAFYRQSKEGVKNRRKLRIRIYDDRPEGVAYLEIKRRTGETVHKLRATVRKSACQSMLRGEHLSPDDLQSMSEVGLRALDEFCDAKERYGADGVAYVDYLRVAYVSRTADNCRVTFDRQLVSRPYSPLDGLCPPPASNPVDMRGVVLELKYNGRAPRWMHDLVRTFNLQRCSFPKYVYCADALGVAPAAGLFRSAI